MSPTIILIVEDNQTVRHVLGDTLRLEGWHVEMCADGSTALRMIESDRHYDLLLLDNDLPGVSGLELIRHARQQPRWQQTPIIMLSAGVHQAEARRAGADAFLRKPEDMYVLVKTVARLLGGGSDHQSEGH